MAAGMKKKERKPKGVKKDLTKVRMLRMGADLEARICEHQARVEGETGYAIQGGFSGMVRLLLEEALESHYG
jgi:hypothetical protein